MSIKVAVRVRPFNERERKLRTELCVDMEGNTTKLIDEDGNERLFAFDHSFWSHNDFEEDDEGILRATGDKYADQDYVYDRVGREILENAWKGYHCCLFAYGQTGAGKSYSMIGKISGCLAIFGFLLMVVVLLEIPIWTLLTIFIRLWRE